MRPLSYRLLSQRGLPITGENRSPIGRPAAGLRWPFEQSDVRRLDCYRLSDPRRIQQNEKAQ